MVHKRYGVLISKVLVQRLNLNWIMNKLPPPGLTLPGFPLGIATKGRQRISKFSSTK
jgi:hypothetical protein